MKQKIFIKEGTSLHAMNISYDFVEKSADVYSKRTEEIAYGQAMLRLTRLHNVTIDRFCVFDLGVIEKQKRRPTHKFLFYGLVSE